MTEQRSAFDQRLFACIEAGGTKVIAGIVRGSGEVIDVVRIATTTPVDTLGPVLRFFEDAGQCHGPLAAVGVASFGPVQVDRRSANWGHILATPKPGWSGFDLAGAFARSLYRPVGFDTDVNGAVLAEGRWGAARGDECAIYVTIGTGIGGGALISGQPLHGLRHPEMGHMLPRRHPQDLAFAGTCPFHGDCLEGLASGPAIMARWGKSLSELSPDHTGHAIIADYLAQLVVAQLALLSPSRVILGGGVMGTPGLLDRVRNRVTDLAAGYFGEDAHALVVAPGLGDRAGLLGALALAMDAAV